jgi:hypothetical protein
MAVAEEVDSVVVATAEEAAEVVITNK